MSGADITSGQASGRSAPLTPPAPSPRDWALLIGLSVIWGTAFMGVDLSLDGFSPLWVAAGRTLIAALALLIASQAMGQGLGRVTSPKAWGFVMALGIAAAALPFSLLSWGQQHVPSAFAGVSMGAVPLVTLLLAMAFSPEEGVGPRGIAGVALGFVGLIVLVGPGVFDAGSDNVALGRIACVLSALSYAAGNILTRRAPPVPPIAMATGAMSIAAMILVPTALIFEGPPELPDMSSSSALLWVALGPTALAAFLSVRIIQNVGSLFLSQVSYMVPLWSVIFGVTLLNETLRPELFIALALILSGIALGQWSALRRR